MKTIEISKNANPNYLAKVVKLDNLRKHSNADRLQIATIDFQDVVTGLEAKNGDVYVYFPVECKINKDFLSFTNSFRDKELNADKEKSGFFEDKCRVKAVKLRNEKSMGYIVPASKVNDWSGVDVSSYVNEEFDTVNGIKICEKYIIKEEGGKLSTKKGKSPKLSRLIDGQVNLHIDTENLRKNAHKINTSDTISITYKTHGTSFWTSHVKVKKDLKWYEKIFKKLGFNIVDSEYDIIYGSRRVVKNKSFEDPKGKDHFFGYDLWKDIKDQIADKIPKGYSLYGECLGYTKDGGYIQEDYDYNCEKGKFKLEIYRITVTNEDGFITELSYPEIAEFCEKAGLTPSHLFYYGKAIEILRDSQTLEIEINEDIGFEGSLVNHLEKKYNEKDCFMCKNKVPEEGVVIRKESLFNYEAYKLKSFRFLQKESLDLDKGQSDLESEN